jgi:hypothetical protein
MGLFGAPALGVANDLRQFHESAVRYGGRAGPIDLQILSIRAGLPTNNGEEGNTLPAVRRFARNSEKICVTGGIAALQHQLCGLAGALTLRHESANLPIGDFPKAICDTSLETSLGLVNDCFYALWDGAGVSRNVHRL